MKINIVAVGKIKSHEYEIYSKYKKRIPWTINLIEIDNKNNNAKFIIKKIPNDSLIVLLDVNGQQLTSEEFARFVTDNQLGNKAISFIIGGADGHNEEVRAFADSELSLSIMTFSHKLSRILLIEQLYRVYSIYSGHPYHK